ncbi:MAG: amino-acid N-acetyltransferase [Treponema sp.]|jgi:amino-acid N-acetyltransferase|nr:amino-acid N-acetyltransferase [Treponema sp.]
MNQMLQNQVDLIREAFHYQSRFDGSTMVFKIDFPVTEDPSFPTLMKDLALLALTGFRVVIVPGAKEWIDAVLRKYDIVSTYAGNTRITTKESLPFVEMAAFHVATRFMTALSGSQVDAVIGNLVRARGLGVIDGVDMEHTGMVDKIYTDSFNHFLNQGTVPILPCIGWSPSGKPYNVPSDEIALAASAALGAVKLFFISLHGGLREGVYTIPEGCHIGENGRIIRLNLQEAETILAANRDGPALGGNGDPPYTAECNKPETGSRALYELRLAIQALKANVDRVHIIDGREDGSILRELFSNMGAGTMVYADEHESIRNLRSSDIPVVLKLMEPLMQQGNLVRRNAEDIQEKKNDYVVYEIDGQIHACGALHLWGEQGEIAAMATDPVYSDMGLGKKIVHFLVDRARKQQLRRVFVLTTRTHDWFETLGFKEDTLESLPEKRRRHYNQSRKSKVFTLEI